MAVIRLHLLGFTPDLKGLVFSGRRGGRSGTYWITVDEGFARAVGQLEEAREEARRGAPPRVRKGTGKQPAGRKGAAGRRPTATSSRGAPTLESFLPRGRFSVTDTQDLPLPRTPPRPQSKLSPREIQQMLREGRSVKDVAGAAGVEQEWVERFVGPVLHEMAGIIQMTLRSHQSRPRKGASGLPIGEAIGRNLEVRRATANTIEELATGWDARRIRPRTWRVRLRFTHRGSRRVAEWEFRTDTRLARPRNKLAGELGWSAEGPGIPPRRIVTAIPPPPPSEQEGEAAAGDGGGGEPESARGAGKSAERKPARRKPARRKPARRQPARSKPARRKGQARKSPRKLAARRKPARAKGTRKPARAKGARKPTPRQRAARGRARSARTARRR